MRWSRVGPAARKYLRAIGMGLDGLVDLCRKRRVSQVNMGGHKRSTSSVRKFFLAADCVTYVAEAVSAELLDDSRVMLKLDYYRSVIADEFAYINTLTPYVWLRLGRLLDVNSIRVDVSFRRSIMSLTCCSVS